MQATVRLPVTFSHGSQRRDVYADSEVTATEPRHCPAGDLPTPGDRQDIDRQAEGHSKASSWNCSRKASGSNTCRVSAAKCEG